MIDFVKMIVKVDSIESFRIGLDINLVHKVEPIEGEFLGYEPFNVENYEVAIKPIYDSSHHYIEIKGSLHKNYFEGRNDQRFTHQMVCEEIDNIEKLFGIPAEQLRLQNLEFGVNIETPFAPYQFLKDNLLLVKTKRLDAYQRGADGKYLGYFYRGITGTKVYDKGKQYDLSYNLMRFELRYIKSIKINECQVYNLADLRNLRSIIILKERLLQRWDEILLYESDLEPANTSMTEGEKLFYKNCNVRNYWDKVINEKHRNSFLIQRKKLRSLIIKHGRNDHQLIRNLLEHELKTCMSSV